MSSLFIQEDKEFFFFPFLMQEDKEFIIWILVLLIIIFIFLKKEIVLEWLLVVLQSSGQLTQFFRLKFIKRKKKTNSFSWIRYLIVVLPVVTYPWSYSFWLKKKMIHRRIDDQFLTLLMPLLFIYSISKSYSNISQHNSHVQSNPTQQR